jgi:phospholipid/cholesterol/gamma-HCH transport system substrate-binding protein
MTREPTDRRRRRETRRPYHVVASGLAVIGVLLGLGYAALRTPNGVPGVPYKTFYASVPDPGNIQPHNDVRIGGVRVGQVIGVKPRNQRALVELKLSPGTEDLPKDTTVFVRAQGLLGARFIELQPGSSREQLEEGATIRGGARALTYGLPETLNTFDAPTRRRLGDTVDGLGAGLLARGDELNKALRAAPPAGRQFLVAERAILSRPRAARRLVPSLESGVAAIDRSREDIARGIAPAADALQPFVDRRDALAGTLDEAPPALRSAQSGLDEGRRLLAGARVLATAAADTLPDAPGGLRAASALLRESRVPLQRSVVLLRQVRPAVPAALRVVRRVSPLLHPLRRAFDDLDPIVARLGRHACDIDNFGENWRSALGYGIAPTGDPAGVANDTALASGFIGPLQAFRIGVFLSPTWGVQGVSQSSSPPGNQDPYAAPCKFSPGPRYLETPRSGSTR